MKLIAYLVPDDFHDGKLDLPEVQLCLAEYIDDERLTDENTWKIVGSYLASAFCRACRTKKKNSR